MPNGQLPGGAGQTLQPTFDRSAILEAFRRRAGQPSSSAAIPGGAQAANQTTPQNPLADLPQTAKTVGGAPGKVGGLPSSPSQPARDALSQAKPSEAEIITKALIQRQRKLEEAGGASPLA